MKFDRPLGAMLCVAILAAPLWPQMRARQRHIQGAFACHSQRFYPLQYPKNPDVISPDGRSEIHITKRFAFRVISGGKRVATLSFRDISCCIEVGWSPDSRQFFILYSDGGLVGGFHVHLYRIEPGRVVESPAPRVVAKEFGSNHYSDFPQNNLYLLDWTRNSRDVFLVAEVPPESFYGRWMGFYTGFLVSASTGRVLRRFGEKETAAIEKSCRASGTLSLPEATAADAAPAQ